MATQRALIALGSNLGDRRRTLEEALRLLGRTQGVKVLQASGFHETRPVAGPPGQGDFLNAAAEIRTSLTPKQLLAVLNGIETRLGRDRAKEQRWGPRTCDLDILMIGELVLDESDLTVPHPRMHERRFVLEPLSEIAPDAVDPRSGMSVAQMLAAVEARS